MTLEEEVRLLKEKRDLLIEIEALESGKTTRLPIYPYNPPWQPPWLPWSYNDTSCPSRLNDVDPLVREGMRQPCTFS